MASGRTPGSHGFHDVDALQAWLDPFIDSSHAISYPTNREISAAQPDVLKSPKYEQMMRTGKQLSANWNFGVVALTSAIGRIAQAFEGALKGVAKTMP